MNQHSIQFDKSSGVFSIQLAQSIYFLRVLESGELIHLGWSPVSDNGKSLHDGKIKRVAAYEDENYVWEQQGRRFEYKTFGDTTYRDVALKAEFAELAEALKPGEAANMPVRDVRLRYVRHETITDASPGLSAVHGISVAKSGIRPTLCIHLKDAAYPFDVRLFYRITVEHDIIERWVEIENGCKFDVEISRCAFASVHVPHGTYELLRVEGIWSREFIPVRQTLRPGLTVLKSMGLNTGHSANPFFLLGEQGKITEDHGAVYFGALAYSGNWEIAFEAAPTTALCVHGGYESSDFELKLAPGEIHRTPAMIVGCASDGWGGASRLLHAFARDYVLPCRAADAYRPVLYNSWEATTFNLSLSGQIQLAERAADIGVELFCVDDGWFGSRRTDRAGLGDWTVSRDVFPNGLAPLIDRVKALGMKFGIWVEPEMVNPDSDLYRAHPDWVLHFPGRPRTECRQQLILDLARKEVVEYLFASIDRLLHENDISFIKWDMNRPPTEPGSVGGASIWQMHMNAVYSLMDRLRKAHPAIDIETCSGGGGRIDMGIFARTDQAWVSDNTDANDRVFIQEGFSLAYPTRTMEAWVTEERNGVTGRGSSLDLRFDVAMRGALGIGSNIADLSAAELDRYRRKISFYKLIRPVVQAGQLYRLQNASDQGVSTWLTVSADGLQAVCSQIALNQLQGIVPAPQRLKALRNDKMYVVVDDALLELGCFSGPQLMTLGLPNTFGPLGIRPSSSSRTLLLKARC